MRADEKYNADYADQYTIREFCFFDLQLIIAPNKKAPTRGLFLFFVAIIISH